MNTVQSNPFLPQAKSDQKNCAFQLQNNIIE